MRPVTKKILESGLLDKHVTAMLERWGTIDPGGEWAQGNRKLLTQDQLEKFVEELEELVDREEETMRETPLDLPVGVLEEFVLPEHHIVFRGRWDNMGRLLVDARLKIKRGEQINCTTQGKFFRALDVTTLYKDEEAYVRLVTVEDW
jgi:hypothetical protein